MILCPWAHSTSKAPFGDCHATTDFQEVTSPQLLLSPPHTGDGTLAHGEKIASGTTLYYRVSYTDACALIVRGLVVCDAVSRAN